MITLTRAALPAVPDLGGASQQSWPLKITAVADGDAPSPMASEIFVFHANNRTDASPADQFWAVASIHQMNDFPKGRPVFVPGDEAHSIPFYRLDTLTFDCLSPDEAESLWLKIREDVDSLASAVTALSRMTDQEVVIV